MIHRTPLEASIYKEYGLNHTPFVERKSVKKQSKAVKNGFRVRVVYKGVSDHFNTHANSKPSAIKNALYRFSKKHLQRFDNKDFDSLRTQVKEIALRQLMKDVSANGKINIVGD